jgi:type I restriction-modification system DNA methylase subunit
MADAKKAFAAGFNQLCRTRQRGSVWADLVSAIACSIANAVDKRFFDEREAQYMRIIGQYNKDEQQLFPELFNLIVESMDENPDQDFLGELYMTLELGNSNAGQFFTPYDICRCMSEATIDGRRAREMVDKQGYISINDPACGAGATLVSAANTLRRLDINYQTSALFVGQDLDGTVAMMCYIQLSLLGCPGYVHVGDTLTDPMTGSALFGDGKPSTWCTPMFFRDVWEHRRAIAMLEHMLGKPIQAAPAAAKQGKRRQSKPEQLSIFDL